MTEKTTIHGFDEYAFQVDRGDADEFYLSIPRLPGVNAQGADIESALQSLRSAYEDWTEDVMAHGGTVPPPADVTKFSGYTSLRMAPSLHAKLASLADAEGVSLNSFVVSTLSATVGAAHMVNETAAEYGHLGQKVEAFSDQLAELRAELARDRRVQPGEPEDC